MRATWAGDVDSIETSQTPKRKPPQRRITVVGINAVEDQQPPPDTGKGAHQRELSRLESTVLCCI